MDNLFITTNGIVFIENAVEAGTTIDEPEELVSYFNVYDLECLCLNAEYEYEKVIRDKSVFYFGISKDETGKYFLDKRTDGTEFCLFAPKSPTSYSMSTLKTEKDVFKLLKKEAKSFVNNLNSYYADEVFNYHLYGFDGEFMDVYFCIYGKDFRETIELLFGKIHQKFSMNDNYDFDYLASKIKLTDDNALEYLSNSFEVEDLDDLISVKFSKQVEETFLKENILHELYDGCNANSFLKKVFNEMVFNIINRELQEFID